MPSWKPEEDAILKELYAEAPQAELLARLPGRSWKAITFRGCNVFRIFRKKEIIQEKIRQTNLTKRGVEYPTQSARVQEKIKATVREKYGVDNVFQADEIKDKITKANLKKFGYKNPNQNPCIRAKFQQTCLNKYGVNNPFKLTNKIKQGMLNKYGKIHPLQIPEIKEKQQVTNINKYGVKTPSQNSAIKEALKKKLNTLEVRHKKYEALKKNNNFGYSKQEILFLQYLRAFDEEIKSHVLHPSVLNVIDYYSPKYDLWIQFDGVYWHGKREIKENGPQSKRIKEIIERDRYQNENIPNLIRFWSDDVEKAIKEGTILNLIESTIKEKIKLIGDSTTCYQYRKKMEWYGEDLKNLPFNPSKLKASFFSLAHEELSQEIIKFIEKYEWLGTIGIPPKWCFTARYKGFLGGVVLINEPTAYSKILGKDTPKYEALIQRGASASWAPKNLSSRLIMFSCKWMIKNTEKRAFIGYADPAANEKGIIYRACNFDFLGSNFGITNLLRHPFIPRLFTPQYLRRTSTFIKWCKENNIQIKNDWFKSNGFKNLEAIPHDIKKAWFDWGKRINREAEKINVERKSKYVLVIGRNKKEQAFLNGLKQYKPLPYPKDKTKL